jgi:hypothetical protein
VRRVMAEFIEGGSVRAAVSRELLQKELKFERDPGLRTGPGGSTDGTLTGGSGGGNRGVASVAAAAIGLSSGAAGSGANADLNTNSGSKPTLDKASLDKLRKKQMAEVGTAGAVVVFFIILIALLI